MYRAVEYVVQKLLPVISLDYAVNRSNLCSPLDGRPWSQVIGQATRNVHDWEQCVFEAEIDYVVWFALMPRTSKSAPIIATTLTEAAVEIV